MWKHGSCQHDERDMRRDLRGHDLRELGCLRGSQPGTFVITDTTEPGTTLIFAIDVT